MSNHFYEANRVLKKAIIKISRRKVTAKYQSKYFNNFRSPSRDTGKIIRSLFCFSDQTDIFYLKELEEGRRDCVGIAEIVIPLRNSATHILIIQVTLPYAVKKWN